MNEWINKMWSTHIREYYSAVKRKEILTHGTAWMNFEDVMLSEKADYSKKNAVQFHLCEVP